MPSPASTRSAERRRFKRFQSSKERNPSSLPVASTSTTEFFKGASNWESAFVVETVGLNDQAPLDAMGHPRSESVRLTESFRRRDFGHLESQITIDDPKTYTTPVTIRVNFRLLPDTELIESFCTEDERDLAHLPGK